MSPEGPLEVTTRTRTILGDPPRLGNLVALYEDFHRHPELSMQEVRTSALVARRFEAAGAETHAGVGGTGVVGLLRNGPGPLVMIRGDMDALPIREQTGLKYESVATGTMPDGRLAPVMHACGHDVHTTALVGSVEALARARGQWRGTVMAVAEPAEETAEGAEAMLRDGLFKRFGKPDVALAQHVHSLEVGHVAHAPGLVTSGALNVDVRIFGKGGHASMPEHGVDPIMTAAFLVTRLQTIVARELPPNEPAVVTVGMFQSGIKANVIPDEANLALNLRFRSGATRDKMLAAIKRIADAESEASRCPRLPEIRTSASFPPVSNDPAVEVVTRSVHEAFGPAQVHDLPIAMGSEDFSAFGLPGEDHYPGEPVPYSFWIVGAHPEHISGASADPPTTCVFRDPVPHTAQFAPVEEPTLRAALRP